jgi:hypothetical protein
MRGWIYGIVIPIACAVVAPVYGGVVVGSVGHSVSVFSTGDGVGGTHPSSIALYYLSPTAFDLNLGLDDPSIGRAHQTNQVTTNQIGATGYADVFNGLDGVGANLEARSQFDVFFEVTVAQTYLLEGSLLIGPNDSGQGGSTVSLDLTGPVNWSFTGTTSLNSMGTLTPGLYHLAVDALSQGDDPLSSVHEADYSFCLTFAAAQVSVPGAQVAAPEPSSVWAWLGILVCIVGSRPLQPRLTKRLG